MAPVMIGIMGPDKDEKALPAAEALGRAVAEAGYIVLTGGRSRGVMDAACRGAKAAGGTTVGIYPGDSLEGVSPFVDIPIVTGLGSARNNINALSSAVLVAVGMGPGTASEVALALKAGKHVVLLNYTAPGSDHAFNFFSELSPSHQVHAASDVAGVMTHISSLLKAQPAA